MGKLARSHAKYVRDNPGQAHFGDSLFTGKKTAASSLISSLMTARKPGSMKVGVDGKMIKPFMNEQTVNDLAKLAGIDMNEVRDLAMSGKDMAKSGNMMNAV